jgi:deoxyribodipyrimidine photo-lyase
VASLPLDASVAPVGPTRGGRPAGLARMREFLKRRLRGYADSRSAPRSLAEGHQSGLSPYLHFGHVSIEEVAEAVLGEGFSEAELFPENAGKRENFFSRDADVNAFLDEALVWRDAGFLWQAARRRDAASLERALPGWALATLRAHARDRRAFSYSLEEWEAGQTHDPLWNAAQRELRLTGTIHNYLRMLWGKKVLEWSRTPEEAYATLVHLNNKYALDGRDPNSWSGILWCLGLFDRPWPERRVYGVVRSMSSESAAKKFDLAPYYAYVAAI